MFRIFEEKKEEPTRSVIIWGGHDECGRDIRAQGMKSFVQFESETRSSHVNRVLAKAKLQLLNWRRDEVLHEARSLDLRLQARSQSGVDAAKTNQIDGTMEILLARAPCEHLNIEPGA